MGQWTTEEVSILEDNYPDHTESELEGMLNRSGEAIRRKAQRIDVSKVDHYSRLKSVINSHWLDVNEIDDEFGYFISGFVAGEGSFPISEQSGRKRECLTFQIIMSDVDEEILKRIQDTLNCGNLYYNDPRRPQEQAQVQYQVKNFGDLYKKVIPFFDRYGFYSTHKQKQYNKWRSAVESYVMTERFK